MNVQPEGGLGLPRRKPPFSFSLSFFPFNDRTGSAGTQFIFSISALISLGYCGCLHEPSLLAERSRLQEGTKRWDILLSSFTALWGPLIVLVIASLDKRLGWSAPLPTWVTVSALVLLLIGAGLGTWAMHTNRFFSATVRI